MKWSVTLIAVSRAMMSLSSIESVAEKYFHSLNPIAERICIDVASTRDAYENLWHTLSYKDRSQVVDETIIHPEAVLKYSFYPQDEPGVKYYPCLRLQTGDKFITDYEGGKGSVSKLQCISCHIVFCSFQNFSNNISFRIWHGVMSILHHLHG